MVATKKFVTNNIIKFWCSDDLQFVIYFYVCAWLLDFCWVILSVLSYLNVLVHLIDLCSFSFLRVTFSRSPLYWWFMCTPLLLSLFMWLLFIRHPAASRPFKTTCDCNRLIFVDSSLSFVVIWFRMISLHILFGTLTWNWICCESYCIILPGALLVYTEQILVENKRRKGVQ